MNCNSLSNFGPNIIVLSTGTSGINAILIHCSLFNKFLSKFQYYISLARKLIFHLFVQEAADDSLLGRARNVLYFNTSASLGVIHRKFLAKEHAVMMSRALAEFVQNDYLKVVSRQSNIK